MSEVRKKASKVLASCKNEDQLLVAMKYARLAVRSEVKSKRTDTLCILERYVGAMMFKLGMDTGVIEKC